MLIITIDKDYLLNELDAQQLGEGARMSIVDANGNVIVSSDETMIMGTPLAKADLLNSETEKVSQPGRRTNLQADALLRGRDR